jgi:acyl-CoA synthetase (AMP-forming)/AMP-acid ligase II
VEGTTFFSVIRQLAEADPDRPALTCGDVTLTRAEFVERVEGLAALFAGRGVVEGSTVTIGLPNSIGLVESLFATWAVGAVPQPISDRLPPLERSAIVDLARPALVVGVPPAEAGARPTLESVPRRLPAGSFTPGQEGEIWMRRGPGAPSPYRYMGATARSAADGWESLGDIGEVDADGYVYITERLADMILVGGANVYPAEIEAALDEHPAVQSSCVIGWPDEDLGNVPYAIVELSGPVSDEDLIAYLGQRLAPYKRPRVIERATAPLRDDAGKVRRSALRAERIARHAATQQAG